MLTRYLEVVIVPILVKIASWVSDHLGAVHQKKKAPTLECDYLVLRYYTLSRRLISNRLSPPLLE